MINKFFIKILLTNKPETYVIQIEKLHLYLQESKSHL